MAWLKSSVRPTPAAGFGMGIDRAVLLHEAVHQDHLAQSADVYVCFASESERASAFRIAAKLRSSRAGLRIRMHMGGGAFKKQFKRADASGARWAIVLGPEEIEQQQITLKNLASGAQETVTESDGITTILNASIDE